MAFVKEVGGKRQKRGLTTRQARIERLEERVAGERDARIRDSIEAQLRALASGRRW